MASQESFSWLGHSVAGWKVSGVTRQQQQCQRLDVREIAYALGVTCLHNHPSGSNRCPSTRSAILGSSFLACCRKCGAARCASSAASSLYCSYIKNRRG